MHWDYYYLQSNLRKMKSFAWFLFLLLCLLGIKNSNKIEIHLFIKITLVQNMILNSWPFDEIFSHLFWDINKSGFVWTVKCWCMESTCGKTLLPKSQILNINHIVSDSFHTFFRKDGIIWWALLLVAHNMFSQKSKF